ncbi:MAG: leucine-rich repeat protein, partial [Clostridia bacterium]|nr:leucine-rich repeat protein [Clostridia bacterium]
MNKKYFTLFIAMLLIFTLCFTIVACGETDDDKTNDNKPIEKPSVEDQQPSDGDDLPSVPDEPSEPETPGDGEENEEDTTSLVFELKEDDTYKVTGYTGEPTSIVIPSSYNGKAVTSIGEKAFYKCKSLTSIEIPSSVTSIG